jgi:L-asparaginase/Glu-tRNA(Gln) amidotransferase subunit D
MAERESKLAIISTGGTIEKTYDEAEGILSNGLTVLDMMLEFMQLDRLELDRISLMNKDSHEFSEEDHLGSVSMHSQVLQFSSVVKDAERMWFIRKEILPV